MRKKFLVLTMALALSLSAVACGKNSDEKTTAATTTEEVTTADATESDATESDATSIFTEGPVDPVLDKEAVSELTNPTEAKYENLSFQIPDYFVYNEEASSDGYYYYYSETGKAVASLYVSVQNTAGLTKEEAMKEKEQLVAGMESGGGIKATNAFETEVAGYYTIGIDAKCNVENMSNDVDARFFVIIDTDVEKMICVSLLQSDNTEKNYFPVLEKVVSSIKKAQ